MITFIGIGIVLGSRAQRRLSSIGAALERVSLGDLSARVPVDFGIDATDKLAGQINNQLARLESLISLTRATSATLAHELRSPLARATLAIERAADAAESDRAKQALGEVEAELARIAAVFDSVLRIARIGSQPSLDSGHIEPAAFSPSWSRYSAPWRRNAA
jgi:signal transduction histidine kinase